MRKGYSVSYEAPAVLVGPEDEDPWGIIEYALQIRAFRKVGNERMLVISLLGDPYQCDLYNPIELIGFFSVMLENKAA